MAITINPDATVEVKAHEGLAAIIDNSSITNGSVSISDYELTTSDFANVSVQSLTGENGLASKLLVSQTNIKTSYQTIDDEFEILATYFKDDAYDSIKEKKDEINESEQTIQDNFSSIIDDLNVICKVFENKDSEINNSFRLFYNNLKEE